MPMLQDAQGGAMPQQPAPVQEAAPVAPQRSARQQGPSEEFMPPSAQRAAEQVQRQDGLVHRGEQPATEEEQEDFDQAVEALYTILYSDDDTSQTIVDSLQPEDPVGSVVKTGLLLIQQLDERLNLDETVFASLTEVVADALTELAEQAKGIEYSEQDLQAVLGSLWEGVMGVFGVDEQGYGELVQGVGADEVKQYEREYKGYLGEDL